MVHRGALMTMTDVVENLVAANRILADHDVVDGYGHVSGRHPRDPTRCGIGLCGIGSSGGQGPSLAD